MELSFLGTGAALPPADRVQSGALLAAGDRRLLVDAGSGVLHRLSNTDTGVAGVDTVLLTHLHLDHVADLLPLFKARWLADEDALTVVGPPGTETLVEELFEAFEYLQDRMPVAVREIGEGPSTVAGFDLTAMETRHSVDGLAYRFADELTITGDTREFQALVDFAAVGSVLVHDCSFPDATDAETHTTPSKLARVLDGAALERVYLTHLYPQTEGHHDAMVEAIRSRFDGEVTIARDGLSIQI
ncbi:MAG: MBL fold metallo-hydrolase [Halodesulfurarchaeum sp.]